MMKSLINRLTNLQIRLICAFIALLTISLPGSAMADGWTGELTVVSAFVEDSDNIVVTTTDGSEYASGCYVNQWTIVMSNEDRRGRAWATILTALTAGRKVAFWYRSTCGNFNYHVASAVSLR